MNNALCYKRIFKKYQEFDRLTLIWMGFLGVRFEVEKLQIWHVITHIFNFIKYTFSYQGPFNFAHVSIFFFSLAKIVSLLKAIV